MTFSEKYFEDEVREGFYVPSMIKRAWATELEVLAQIDRICTKYNIQYFAEWGTLLGAVRHNGFIPWDDDIDIGMKRADYERFLEVAQKELPEGYKINNCRNKDDFWLFLARVMNTGHICFDDEYLKRNHEFPYIAGVDIFLMDYVSRDEEKEKNRDTIADFTITLADYIFERRMGAKEAMEGLVKINRSAGERLVYDEGFVRRWLSYRDDKEAFEKDKKDIAALHQRMYMYAEHLFARFGEKEADELTQLYPFGLRKKEYRYPKKYYESCIRLPFENTTIPVPIGYDAMLKRRYGDYMAIHKNSSGHGYPFFESQQEQLDKLLEVRLPAYQYTETEHEYSIGVNTGKNAAESFRQLALEAYSELKTYDDAQTAQALAIDFGTMIEQIYGEGHPTVAYLEDYCEQLYLYSQGSIERSVLEETIEKLYESIRRDILDVRETAFIVSEASRWRYMRHEYEHVRSTGGQVYVVVVPYYHKRYDGTLYDERNEYECFLEMGEFSGDNIHLVPYDKYDIVLHHPDCVYIQIPYDNWNHGISIHPSYYTDNIIENCESMVYVPSFALDEFTQNNYCEYHNMSEYVTVPGVVRANTVLVQSGAMRERYIEKLVEWAGDDSRKIWEEKLLSDGTQLEDSENVEDRKRNAIEKLPVSWKKEIFREDGSRKKIVLYHNEAGIFVEYKAEVYNKILNALEIFRDNRNDIFVIWNINEGAEHLIDAGGTEDAEKLRQIMERADEVGACDISDGKIAQAAADAFYGDGCYLSRICQLEGKPVMLENIEIMN